MYGTVSSADSEQRQTRSLDRHPYGWTLLGHSVFGVLVVVPSSVLYRDAYRSGLQHAQAIHYQQHDTDRYVCRDGHSTQRRILLGSVSSLT